MYVVTSMPLVSRTRATFRRAEFGFLGVVVYTRVQTPRRWGQACKAGLAVFYRVSVRPLRTSWLNVGMLCTSARKRRRPRAQNFPLFPNSETKTEKLQLKQ